MKKLNYLKLTAEGEVNQKLNSDVEENDSNFEESVIILDLKEVESIRSATPYKEKKCCNVIMKSGAEFTITTDMDILADEVQTVKNYHILGIN